MSEQIMRKCTHGVMSDYGDQYCSVCTQIVLPDVETEAAYREAQGVDPLFALWRSRGGDMPLELYNAVLRYARGVIIKTWKECGKKTPKEADNRTGRGDYNNRILNLQLLEEVAFDTAVKCLFKKLHQFRGKSAFSTWVYRIAYNAAIDATRKEIWLNEVSLSQPAGLDDNRLGRTVEDVIPQREPQREFTESFALAPPPSLDERERDLWRAIFSGLWLIDWAAEQRMSSRQSLRIYDRMVDKAKGYIAATTAQCGKYVLALEKVKERAKSERAARIRERKLYWPLYVEIVKGQEAFSTEPRVILWPDGRENTLSPLIVPERDFVDRAARVKYAIAAD